MLYASLTRISGEEDLLKFQLSESATLRHAAHKYLSSRTNPSRPDSSASRPSVMKEDCSDSASNLPNSD